MRTTVTLEKDVVKLLRDTAHRQDRSFKAVLNDAVRAGLNEKLPVTRKKIVFPTFKMGLPTVDMTKANALAGQLEDEEIIRKMHLGK